MPFFGKKSKKAKRADSEEGRLVRAIADSLSSQATTIQSLLVADDEITDTQLHEKLVGMTKEAGSAVASKRRDMMKNDIITAGPNILIRDDELPVKVVAKGTTVLEFELGGILTGLHQLHLYPSGVVMVDDGSDEKLRGYIIDLKGTNIACMFDGGQGNYDIIAPPASGPFAEDRQALLSMLEKGLLSVDMTIETMGSDLSLELASLNVSVELDMLKRTGVPKDPSAPDATTSESGIEELVSVSYRSKLESIAKNMHDHASDLVSLADSKALNGKDFDLRDSLSKINKKYGFVSRKCAGEDADSDTHESELKRHGNEPSYDVLTTGTTLLPGLGVNFGLHMIRIHPSGLIIVHPREAPELRGYVIHQEGNKIEAKLDCHDFEADGQYEIKVPNESDRSEEAQALQKVIDEGFRSFHLAKETQNEFICTRLPFPVVALRDRIELARLKQLLQHEGSSASGA